MERKVQVSTDYLKANTEIMVCTPDARVNVSLHTKNEQLKYENGRKRLESVCANMREKSD